jgi:hypothetical protein
MVSAWRTGDPLSQRPEITPDDQSEGFRGGDWPLLPCYTVYRAGGGRLWGRLEHFCRGVDGHETEWHESIA